MSKPITHLMSSEGCSCKIKQLLVVEATEFRLVDSKYGEISHITKSGEMALIDWYRQNNEEINGKFVSSIVYEEKTDGK